MTTKTTQSVEWQVQVLVEMEDGSEVTHNTRNFVERCIPQMFPSSTRDIRTIITVTNEEGAVTATKYDNNPTKQLRERAWVNE